MKSKLLFSAAAIALGCMSLSNAALAQRDAGSKIRGDAYNVWTGSTYQHNAVEHSQILNDYAGADESAPSEVVQEHAQGIRGNVEASRRAFARLSDAAKTDPEAAKLIAEIEKHHAKALALCEMLEAESAKSGAADSKKIVSCSTDVEKELNAAEHAAEKLSKHLKIETPATKKK